MKTVYEGYAVVSVNCTDNIEPSHSDIPGWYQEVYETPKQAEKREEELLEVVGGIFEVVKVTLSFKRGGH